MDLRSLSYMHYCPFTLCKTVLFPRVFSQTEKATCVKLNEVKIAARTSHTTVVFTPCGFCPTTLLVPLILFSSWSYLSAFVVLLAIFLFMDFLFVIFNIEIIFLMMPWLLYLLYMPYSCRCKFGNGYVLAASLATGCPCVLEHNTNVLFVRSKCCQYCLMASFSSETSIITCPVKAPSYLPLQCSSGEVTSNFRHYTLLQPQLYLG